VDSQTKPLIFKLPWGRATQETVMVKTDKGIRYQTEVRFSGSGRKYAEAFFAVNTSATELLMRANRALDFLAGNSFWTDVQRAALRKLKEKKR
jgi:hypothetical protein